MTHPRTTLRDIDRVLIHSVMFQLGIIPIEAPEHDIGRVLRQLPVAEQRVLKRKFRKLWRKAMKQRVIRGRNYTQTAVGLSKRHPSREQKQARKRLVFNEVWLKIIVPLLRAIENPKNVNNVTKVTARET